MSAERFPFTSRQPATTKFNDGDVGALMRAIR
jgi:hypothetical protein